MLSQIKTHKQIRLVLELFVIDYKLLSFLNPYRKLIPNPKRNPPKTKTPSDLPQIPKTKIGFIANSPFVTPSLSGEKKLIGIKMRKPSTNQTWFACTISTRARRKRKRIEIEVSKFAIGDFNGCGLRFCGLHHLNNQNWGRSGKERRRRAIIERKSKERKAR